jgi:hypothetical protein
MCACVSHACGGIAIRGLRGLGSNGAHNGASGEAA